MSFAAISVLSNMVKNETLAGRAVEALVDNFQELNSVRMDTQAAAGREYDQIQQRLETDFSQAEDPEPEHVPGKQHHLRGTRFM